jgi:predicted DNA-binding transcriptional regulator AlpA
MEPTDLATLSKAATLAGVSRWTLYKHISAGTAPQNWRIGREVVFKIAEVLAWRDEFYPAKKPRQGRKRRA